MGLDGTSLRHVICASSIRMALEGIVTNRRTLILPVAAALGALTSVTPAMGANAASAPDAVTLPKATPQAAHPNTLVSVGQDLLAFTINEQADGTVVAQHVSHASHSSHASHRSHYSSR